MKKISVIVPIYNTVKYLKKCLISIEKQTYRDFQVILVDDGSFDGSECICDEYSKKDKRFKVIHQKNAGLINARKVGAKEAEGEYIYYVDSDDWIDDNVLESFNLIIQNYNVDMILIGQKREYENGNSFVEKLPFENGIYDKLLIRKHIFPEVINHKKRQRSQYWNYLIDKRLVLRNLKNVDERIRLLEDAVVVYPCLLDSEYVYIKKDIYYHYIQRGISMKRSCTVEEYQNLQQVYEILVNRFVKEPEEDLLLKQVKNLLLYNLLFTMPEKIKVEDGLFPYENFPKSSRVVVYGAGIFGSKIIELLNQSNYANVVAWLDKDPFLYHDKKTSIETLDKLIYIDCDYIILGSIAAIIREDMKKELMKYHIPKEKIIDVDWNKFDTMELPEEFKEILDDVQPEILSKPEITCH